MPTKARNKPIGTLIGCVFIGYGSYRLYPILVGDGYAQNQNLYLIMGCAMTLYGIYMLYDTWFRKANN